LSREKSGYTQQSLTVPRDETSEAAGQEDDRSARSSYSYILSPLLIKTTSWGGQTVGVRFHPKDRAKQIKTINVSGAKFTTSRVENYSRDVIYSGIYYPAWMSLQDTHLEPGKETPRDPGTEPPCGSVVGLVNIPEPSFDASWIV